jgi:hypothetical protein
MKLPDPANIRRRIENVEDKEVRNFLKALYLLSAMPAEMYGEVYPKERNMTHAYGPSHHDVWKEQVNIRNMKIAAVCFKVRTAKKKKLHERTVRLPIESDQWAEELYNYFINQKGDRIFPFYRQIMRPRVIKTGIFKDLKKSVKYRDAEHSFGMDDLRIVRGNELRVKFKFSKEDLEEYGSAMGTTTRIEGQRDDSLNETRDPEKWKEYFEKLYTLSKLEEGNKEKLKVDEVELKLPFSRILWRKKKEKT